MEHGVKIGSRVEMVVNGKRHICDIVPAREANLDDAKFSCEAPLVKLILGLEAGQGVKGFIKDKEVQIEIRKVF